MTSVSTRIILFSLLAYLTVCGAYTPSGQVFIDLFGNPVKDLKKIVENFRIKASPVVNKLEEGKQKETNGDRSDTKMIDVPLNKEKCPVDTKRDINGECRQPW